MKLIVFISILFVHTCYAWGPKGQQITVMVSEKFLKPSALSQILKITGGKPLSSFSSWADQARNTAEWSETGIWHYINVDDSGSYAHETQGTPLDVVTALDYSLKNFQNSKSDKDRLTWLKFIIHLVGDLHQPMHIGDPQDRGGNSTQVSYGKEMNLHYLWDSGLIDKKGLSVQAFTSQLISYNWSTSELSNKFDAEKVVEENFKSRKFLYSFKNGTIDSQYEKQAIELIENRLWIGGLRLASLLNSILK